MLRSEKGQDMRSSPKSHYKAGSELVGSGLIDRDWAASASLPPDLVTDFRRFLHPDRSDQCGYYLNYVFFRFPKPLE
jgi:hypothetical protein